MKMTMKTLPRLFLAFGVATLSAYAAAPGSRAPAFVALRYVTAAHAFSVIKQQLGEPAAKAVSLVDEKQNLITLDAAHTEAPIVRAFLSGLDHQPPEVRVDATITRHLKATAVSPARDEVMSRQTIRARSGRPAVHNIPDDKGSTLIELRVTPMGK